VKRCPACNARYKKKDNCHRCGMNIASLIEIKNRAKDHYKQAIKHFFKSEFKEMFIHARRSCSLYRTPESIQILACAALMINRFEMAIKLWQQYSNCMPFVSDNSEIKNK